MSVNYEILISKLNSFIKKYYTNLLIRGGLYATGLFFFFFLFVNLLEYYARFDILTRTFLFYSYILINAGILWKFVLIPLAKLFRIGKCISHEYASEIIGKHFSEVQDKLLNTLQLKELADNDSNSKELIFASIDQRINQLKPIAFVGAIDLRKNSRYIKYAAIPLVIFIAILLSAPKIIKEPANRLVQHNVYFEPPLPFHIEVLNDNFTIVQQDDFTLEVALSGKEIPNDIYIQINNSEKRLVKRSNISFYHVFRNIQRNTKFKLTSGGYYTKEYEIRVLARPVIINFETELVFPSYTGKSPQNLLNTGDIIAPEGTKVSWKFYTKDAEKIVLNFAGKKETIIKAGSNAMTYTKRIKDSENYSIISANKHLINKDSLLYMINAIPDAFPEISVEEHRDSVYEKHFYFKGMIKDDYGFKKLTFNYKISRAEEAESSGTLNTENVNINNNTNQQIYYHHFDISEISLEQGEEIVYFFEVWDNDGVNGSKSSRSSSMFFKMPSKEEIQDIAEKSNDKYKSELEKIIGEAKKLQEESKKLEERLIEKKKPDWQDKKKAKELLKKHEEIQKKLEEIQKEHEENFIRQQQYEEKSDEMVDKFEQLNELLEELMTDEMKELLEKMDEMMDDINKDEMMEMMDDMQLSNEDLEKELDRSLELWKQFELEVKMEETIEKIKDLANKQEELSEETAKDKKGEEKEDLIKKQEEISEEFEKIKEDLEDIKKKNKELEEPNKLKDTEQKEQAIQEKMKESEEALEKKKNKKASESQKEASDEMEEMAESMEQQMMEMQAEESAEDVDALREILENLVQLSFDQEALMNKLKVTKKTDPQYIDIIKQQKDIKDDLQKVEDSLFALSKRQASIKSFVNKEINKINDNVEKAITSLLDLNSIRYSRRNQKQIAIERQQFAMTSINNLALLLSESLEQMKQEMNQKQQGSGQSCKSKSCQKKGEGKPSMKSLRKMQEELNKQMEQMKQGKKPGGQKSGQSMSEQLARMAAQQSAIRRQLQNMRDQLYKDGKGDGGRIDKLGQMMDQTETDLVNKIISQETLNRQKNILTRLLESERAEMQREKEEKRESVEEKNQLYSNPMEFFQYKRLLKQNEEEILKKVDPSFNSFYKVKIKEYFYNFEE